KGNYLLGHGEAAPVTVSYSLRYQVLERSRAAQLSDGENTITFILSRSRMPCKLPDAPVVFRTGGAGRPPGTRAPGRLFTPVDVLYVTWERSHSSPPHGTPTLGAIM